MRPGLLTASLTVALFALVPASFAQADDPAGRNRPEASKSRDAEKMPMMAHMERMITLQSALEEAKGAAEAQGDKVVVAKIDKALKLLEQDHQAMHQHMGQMKQRMKERMAEMGSMGRGMQKMKEGMGKIDEMRPMQSRMQAMQQRMEKMHGHMKAEAQEYQMKCPRCKKPMAAKPKVINRQCPIVSGKLNPYTVPDKLTREFDGKKIGFCCQSCAEAWDKLSEQAKEKKLAAMTAKPHKQGGARSE